MLRSVIIVNAILILFLLGGYATCSDFIAYLDSLGLSRLTLIEFERSCLEDCDPKSCLRYLEATGGSTSKALIDSVIEHGCKSSDGEALKLIIEGGNAFLERDYSNAEAILEKAISLLPSIDLLVEAALLSAKVKQGKMQHEIAAEMLEILDQYVESNRRPEILYLRGLSGLKVSPDVGIADLKRAFEYGLSIAGVDLLRAYLIKGDTLSFRQVLTSLPTEDKRVVEGISDLICEIDGLVPEIWNQLLEWLLASPSFAIRSSSCLCKTLVEKSLVDSSLTPCWLKLYQHAGDDESRALFGFASAVSIRSIDSLIHYSEALSDWRLSLKSCLAVLSEVKKISDTERQSKALAIEQVLDRLARLLDEHRSEIGSYDKIKIVRLIVESSYASYLRPICKEYLTEVLLKRSEPLIEIAKLALFIDPSLAKEVAEKVISSPMSTAERITAKRVLWELEWMVTDSLDLSAEIDRALGLDDDRSKADYFYSRLKQPERSLPYYRKALRSANGPVRDSLMFWTGRCLARSVERGNSDLKEETYALIFRLASSNVIAAGDVIDIALAATDFLENDREFVVKVARELLKSNQIEAADLMAILEAAYMLFLLGEDDAYEICVNAAERLIVEFRSSEEAGVGMLIDGRIRKILGNYSSAIKRFETAAQEWKSLDRVAKRDIADCLISLGKLGDAIDLLKSCDPDARLLYRLAKCLDLVGDRDSALFYYQEALENTYEDMLVREIRLDLGICMVQSGQSLDSLGFLDQSFADYCDRSVADDIDLTRLFLRSLLLGKNGYKWVAESNISGIGYLADWLTCRSRLVLADLVSSEDPFRAMMVLPTEGQCPDEVSVFQILHGKARYACMTDSLELCTTYCRDLIRRFPSARPAAERWLVFHMLGRLQSVESSFDLVASIEPEISDTVATIHLAYGKADQMIKRGDFRGAIANLVPIARNKGAPLFFQSCFRLGVAYYMEGVYDSAAYYFEMASGVEDQRLARDALFNAGLSYESGGQPDKAVENFWKCATRFPLGDQFERALLRCGFTLEEIGKFDSAIDVYKAAVRYSRSQKTKAEAQYWLAQCFDRSARKQRAVVEHLRTLYLFGDQEAWAATSAYEAGLGCEALGWTEEAIKIYKMILAKYGVSTDWGRSSRMRLRRLGVN